MSFTESVPLAERNPDLASAAERVIAKLRELGTPETIRAGDMASFLELDPNQVAAVLEDLAATGFLCAEKMVECSHCGVLALQSDYDEAYEEDSEYRCTCCDRPLGAGTILAVTTYRCGEKWPEIAGGSDAAALEGAPTPNVPMPAALDDQTFYEPSRLAEIFNVNRDALRKRLERFRARNLDSGRENEGRRPRQDKYSYRLADVKPILTEMQASSQRPAK